MEIMREELPFPPATFEARIEKVRQAIVQRGLDALLVTAPGNIYYLSAFHTPAYDNFQFMLLPASGEPTMFNNVHESEYLVAARSYVRKRAAYPGWKSHIDLASELLAKEGLSRARIGIEKSAFFFTIKDYERLAANLPGARLEDASGIVEPFRRVKSAEELAVMRQAARVVEFGMQAGMDAIREGASDCEISAAVHHGLIGAGGDYMSYPPFVNVGWNSSLVHNTWNGVKAKSGDLVFLEISGVIRRYGVALMRSAAVGRISDEMERRNRVVHDVLERTLAAIRPGVTSGSVNKACLEAYAEHGYKVLKRAGYSMGINFPPGWSEGNFLDLSHENPVVLEPGMVFHCPQPYRVAGEQTISTSETVVVTADGCAPLTKFPRQLFRK
jgi:Xaa-Pro dipeptidase